MCKQATKSSWRLQRSERKEVLMCCDRQIMPTSFCGPSPSSGLCSPSKSLGMVTLSWLKSWNSKLTPSMPPQSQNKVQKALVMPYLGHVWDGGDTEEGILAACDKSIVYITP